VAQIPPDKRLLVTDHESLSYFADRYGFRFVGAVVPSASSGAEPSARDLAALVDRIRASGASAIFVGLGEKRSLVERVAAETGVKIGAELYSHSISEPGGPAPTYIEMMKYNVSAIVEALR
jgi:ABC-type Zn uptake system ZnuABC Zn-binding protein ZnuA